jgi:rare lipoprotein A (peptidoglycan hydrolase)
MAKRRKSSKSKSSGLKLNKRQKGTLKKYAFFAVVIILSLSALRLSSSQVKVFVYSTLSYLDGTSSDLAIGEKATGEASYYADSYNGLKTANGEIFDNSLMTAAHKHLKLGSIIKVTRLDTGKFITVRVNDRGPYAGNRILDLSRNAAEQLDMTRNGTAIIEMEVISKP